jgi:AraC-like DNA-binding protein
VPDFGFLTYAQGGIGDLGSFGESLLDGATSLGGLLRDFCVRVQDHNPSPAQFFLREQRGSLLFCRRSMMLSIGAWPVEQYVYSLMVDLVRSCAGPDWRPPRVWLQRRRPLERAEQRWLEGVRLTLSSAATMIEVPRSLLVLPVREEHRTHHLPLADRPIEVDGTVLEAAVYGAVLAGLAPGRHGIVDVSELLGTSPRTLQRRLSERGTSFRRVAARARFARARELLEDSRISLGEIAVRVGYDDHGSFSRAFRRWSGTTPIAYRETLTPERAS